MDDKNPFNEMIKTAAIEVTNREFETFPPDVLNPPNLSDEEKFLMNQMFEAEDPEKQDYLLKKLIHCSTIVCCIRNTMKELTPVPYTDEELEEALLSCRNRIENPKKREAR